MILSNLLDSDNKNTRLRLEVTVSYAASDNYVTELIVYNLQVQFCCYCSWACIIREISHIET